MTSLRIKFCSNFSIKNQSVVAHDILQKKEKKLTTSNRRSQPTRHRQEPQHYNRTCWWPTKHSRNCIKKRLNTTCLPLLQQQEHLPACCYTISRFNWEKEQKKILKILPTAAREKNDKVVRILGKWIKQKKSAKIKQKPKNKKVSHKWIHTEHEYFIFVISYNVLQLHVLYQNLLNYLEASLFILCY